VCNSHIVVLLLGGVGIAKPIRMNPWFSDENCHLAKEFLDFHPQQETATRMNSTTWWALVFLFRVLGFLREHFHGSRREGRESSRTTGSVDTSREVDGEAPPSSTRRWQRSPLSGSVPSAYCLNCGRWQSGQARVALYGLGRARCKKQSSTKKALPFNLHFRINLRCHLLRYGDDCVKDNVQNKLSKNLCG
jgi:hypothetical protein